MSQVDVVRRAAWPWWLAALTYYVVCCLMHLRFSIWLVRQRDAILGQTSLSAFVPIVSVVSGVALLLWLVLRLRNHPRRWVTAGYWLCWLGMAVLIDQYLTFSINEYAHYPQYAMLAWLLARAMDPARTRWLVGRVLFWTTLMGMGDEVLQYLWITASYSEYVDFNDFLTNLVAAGAGLLLYYGPATAPRPPRWAVSWPELVTALLIVGAVAVGMGSGAVVYAPTQPVPPGGVLQLPDGSYRLYMQRGAALYGSQPTGPRHGAYHVLTPTQGLLLLVLVGGFFWSYGLQRPRILRRALLKQ